MTDWNCLQDKNMAETTQEVTDNFLKVFRDFTDFKTRSGKFEYWSFTLVNTFIGIIFMALTFIPFLTRGIAILSNIYLVLTIIPSLALMVRRLHDRNHSGWLLLLVPLIAFIALVILFAVNAFRFAGGESTLPNNYGLLTVLTSIVFIIIILYFFVQTILPSYAGENKYGALPDESVRQKLLANLFIIIFFAVRIIIAATYMYMLPKLMADYPPAIISVQQNSSSAPHIPMNVHLVE